MRTGMKAVHAILKDISDRKGLKYEWRQIAPDTQDEIASEWAEIIERESGVREMISALKTCQSALMPSADIEHSEGRRGSSTKACESIEGILQKYGAE